jgi:signal transduction histidine kinase
MGARKSLSDFWHDRSVLLAGLSALLLGLILVDWLTWIELNVSIVYSLPLVLAAAARSRRLLWGMMLALLIVTFTVYFVQVPPGRFSVREPFFINRVLSAVALLLIAGMVHLWMRAVDALEAQGRVLKNQNEQLGAANRELVRRDEQIARQNEELDRRRREAEEASSRKTRLLASVSHDIRTPANAINLLAEVLRRAADNPALAVQVPDMAQRLQANARSLVELVSDVVDSVRLDSGRLDLQESTFVLNDLLAGHCRDLLPLAQAKQLRLELAAPEPPIWLRADRGKLTRVLSNLVGNAIKFTETGGVTVSAALSAGGAALVHVRDTGVGIAPEQRERIFDEFAQLHNPERERTKGWGLGLAICRRLLDVMGGSITVESAPNQGSVFTVCLPPRCVVDCAGGVAERSRRGTDDVGLGRPHLAGVTSSPPLGSAR